MRRFIGSIILIGLVACREKPTERSLRSLSSLDATPPDGGLSLQLIRPVAARRDSVSIGVFIRNAGPAIRFRNEPDWLTFKVVSPSGTSVPVRTFRESGSLGAIPDLVLPRNGVLGRFVNLACAESPYSTTPTTSRSSCVWAFAFIEPGEYRIVAQYAPVPPPGDSAPIRSLTSDTLRVLVSAQ